MRARPPLPVPVPHAADPPPRTHTRSPMPTPPPIPAFLRCYLLDRRLQSITHPCARTCSYLPSPLPPFPLQATSCKAPPQHARRHRMRGAQLPGGLCTTDQRPPSLVVITLTADPPYNAPPRLAIRAAAKCECLSGHGGMGMTPALTHANAHTSLCPNLFLPPLSPPPFSLQATSCITSARGSGVPLSYRFRTAHCISARRPALHPSRRPLYYLPASPCIPPLSRRSALLPARRHSSPYIPPNTQGESYDRCVPGPSTLMLPLSLAQC